LRNITILSLLAAITGLKACSPASSALPTVPEVDIDRYSGTWHEVASYPSRFQKGCNCTTATYTLSDGHVKVENQCFRDGKWDGITGKAFVQEGSGNARLKVQFFWPFKGDYYIIDLADDYSYAMVGHPNREYLWVLSRSPELDANTYGQLLIKAAALGFDVNKLQRTPRDC
jgi:apolipoprotein D and lipocalin family protein